MGYAESARLHGAELRTGARVVDAKRNDGLWQVRFSREDGQEENPSPGRSRGGALLVPSSTESAANGSEELLQARIVINCAGLYGDCIEKLRLQDLGVNPEAPFHVTPRKGQFVVFRPREDAEVPSHIIEPVATEFTKGVIAWMTSYGTIIVGPTAEPQQDREDRSTHAATIEQLRRYGEKTLPAVRDAEVLGTYSGLRPATEFRDYQIEAHPESMWITVGGIRSTGLTASSGIAEHVGSLMEQVLSSVPKNSLALGNNKEETLCGVTEAANRPVPLAGRSRVPNGPLPTLEELSEDYRRRGDGCVSLYGRAQRVTHPLSSFGMEAYVGTFAPS